jgi:putative NIF3 family GTP cyclohydrolase 1 type 2
VLAALRSAHPYEEPAFDLLELADMPGQRGSGRVGVLAAPTTLASFAAHVAGALPATAGGVRVTGSRDQPVRTVAVCAGAGDSLLAEVRATDADVYVTSDLRHHRALEFREDSDGRIALVDVSHWAAEWAWLPQAAARLRAALAAAGATVEIRVSRLCTDPWQFNVQQLNRSERQESDG